jgi:hypothetical protein
VSDRDRERLVDRRQDYPLGIYTAGIWICALQTIKRLRIRLDVPPYTLMVLCDSVNACVCAIVANTRLLPHARQHGGDPRHHSLDVFVFRPSRIVLGLANGASEGLEFRFAEEPVLIKFMLGVASL